MLNGHLFSKNCHFMCVIVYPDVQSVNNAPHFPLFLFHMRILSICGSSQLNVSHPKLLHCDEISILKVFNVNVNSDETIRFVGRLFSIWESQTDSEISTIYSDRIFYGLKSFRTDYSFYYSQKFKEKIIHKNRSQWMSYCFDVYRVQTHKKLCQQISIKTIK